jgi:hypothetical protein
MNSSPVLFAEEFHAKLVLSLSLATMRVIQAASAYTGRS